MTIKKTANGICKTDNGICKVPTVVTQTSSIFDQTTEPASTPLAQNSDWELGMRFTPDVDGQITEVHWYKHPSETGSHTGKIWSIGGSSLATAVYTETASGWQTVALASPLAVTGGTQYIVSVNINAWWYYNTGWGWPETSTNISADTGRYHSNPGTFPNSNLGNQYWVDVTFEFIV
jgi:hypothetical protein